VITNITIRSGTRADLDRLACFHYRASRPATCVRVLVACENDGGATRGESSSPIAVLTVSMPAVNGSWRDAAWPFRYRPLRPTGRMRRACLRRLNSEVRTISRVIVEPRYRGLGIAARLIRAYLDDPLTPHTEAVAAMGRFCPMFERAGMSAVPCPPSRRVIRLRGVLRKLGIEPWRLADPATLLESLSTDTRARLVRALRVFAADHRDTRARAGSGDVELVGLAARRIDCRPAAYVHSAHGVQTGGVLHVD
jgi:hypothetical protein